MIYGTGSDIVEIERISKIYKKYKKFTARILDIDELNQIENLHNKRRCEFIAGRFATKEAFSKALKTGIGKSFNFQHLAVLNDKSGAPYCKFNEPLKSYMSRNNLRAHVTISHTNSLTMANVIVEKCD